MDLNARLERFIQQHAGSDNHIRLVVKGMTDDYERDHVYLFAGEKWRCVRRELKLGGPEISTTLEFLRVELTPRAPRPRWPFTSDWFQPTPAEDFLPGPQPPPLCNCGRHAIPPGVDKYEAHRTWAGLKTGEPIVIPLSRLGVPTPAKIYSSVEWEDS